MTDKDSGLIAELERRLYWYREEASEEEFDAEEVDAICVMLQKLSPLEGPRMSKEEVRRNIIKRIEEEDGLEGADDVPEGLDADRADSAEKTDGKDEKSEKKGGKKRHLFRKSGYRAAILFVAVFGAALLSLNMVTYAREDKSLFTMIMERVGWVDIVKETTEEEIGINRNSEIETFCNSWTELDSEVKSKIEVPEYIPDDYELYGIYYYSFINRKWVRAKYYNKGNGHLLVEITLWEDEDRAYWESAMDENGHKLLTEYSDENTLYYEYEDEYICMVSMKSGFCRISGNIELEEMIKIREGLGEIKE